MTPDDLEVWGLPLHPLVVHGVVVLVPLAALAVLLGALWPALRRRLGLITPLLALAALVLTPVAILSGESLLERVGPVPSALAHEALGRMLPPWAIALFVVAVAQWLWFRRGAGGRERRGASPTRGERAVGIALAAAAVVVAVGSVTMVVLIGEAGARSVWG